MRVLLLTPPMTQINTPYPATAYLTGFLRSRGVDARQADPAIELLLRLLSRPGLREIRKQLNPRVHSPSLKHFLHFFERYEATVESVVRFLQGQDPTFAHRILQDNFLPRGPRFGALSQYGEESEDALHCAFGEMGVQDRAKYLASLYIDDLADVIREGIDPRFELSRYAEKLGASAPSFQPIVDALKAVPTFVDETLDAITKEWVLKHKPDVVGITIPFPGNVYGAFRMADRIRKVSPATKIILGGGYVNTELRSLSDARVFDYADFITFDDGEKPFLCILDFLTGKSQTLLRTMVREDGNVVFKTDPKRHDIPFKGAGIPTYDGLPMEKYLSLCELLNPMHRLWSDGRWNKLTIAHGCYWKKCSFCDLSLDYIGRYEPQGADALVDRIETLVKETGQTGFHFVDEAAPPKTLAAMAEKLIERKVQITWWANIRFEKTFTREVTDLLAKSGCIAVSGGLEVASDRLLALMEKGVTVEQVARVTHAFTQSGIMVHAYLMFGFPSQTAQETIDSLERVRQLFTAGCLQSAYWHRFSATAHSPVGLHPERYGIRLLETPSAFARNDIPFEDSTGVDHEAFHPGLKKALYNYMHGVGLDKDVREWFEMKVPKANVAKTLVTKALNKGVPAERRYLQ